MENKVLKFKNYFLYSIRDTQKILVNSFQDWLIQEKLHGPASRDRTRFIKSIMERSEEINEERIKLLEEHSKNKKGETEWRLKSGKVVIEAPKDEDQIYDVKDMGAFYIDWEKYLQEDYIIDVTPANKELINGIKEIVFNTNSEFSGQEALRYDEWCDAFEAIWAKEEGLKKVDEATPEAVKELIKEKEKE